MTNNGFDLRWWLLNALSNIPNPVLFYQCFLVFFFVGFLFLVLVPNRNRSLLFSDGIFVLFLCLFVLAGRWPTFLAPTLDLDETQFISAAMKLVRDSLFWRSADTGSSGPLNIYPLMAPALFGLKLEYAVSRMIGVGCLVAATLCLYYSIRTIYGNAIARLTVLPVATTVALMGHPSVVSYAGEMVPIAFLGIAIFLTCKYYTSRSSRSNRLLFFLGVVIGSVPYSKFQGVPTAAALAMIGMHILWTKTLSRKTFLKGLATFIAGSFLCTAVILLYLGIFDLYGDFWKSYILQNLLIYSKFSASVSTSVSGFLWWERWILCLMMRATLLDTKNLFLLTDIVFVSALLFLLHKRVRFLTSSKDKKGPVVPVFFYYCLLLCLASVYSVMHPGRTSEHYLLLLIIPSGFAIGVFLGELDQYLTENRAMLLHHKVRPYGAIAFLVVAVSCLHFYSSMNRENRYLANHKSYLDNYSTPVGRAILRHATAGESMAIWGWSPQFHIETGLVQATRDDVCVWQLWNGPLKKYYIDRYCKDMEESTPKLFIDSSQYGIAPCEEAKHEVCPELDALVSRQYRFEEEVQGVRIYARKKQL